MIDIRVSKTRKFKTEMCLYDFANYASFCCNLLKIFLFKILIKTLSDDKKFFKILLFFYGNVLEKQFSMTGNDLYSLHSATLQISNVFIKCSNNGTLGKNG